MDESLKTFGKVFGAVCLTVAVLAQSHFYVENQNLKNTVAGFDTPAKTQSYSGAKKLIEAFNSGPDNVFDLNVAAACAAQGKAPSVVKKNNEVLVMCPGDTLGI